MINAYQGTWHPVHFPMGFTWAAHVAPSTRIYSALNSPPCANVNSLGRLNRLLVMAVLCEMDYICNGSTGVADGYRFPPPLHAICSPGCADASVKTNTGRRCSLAACFEPVPDYHFSHSPWCSVNTPSVCGLSGLVPAPSAPPSGVPDFRSSLANSVCFVEPSPASDTMPRLRERMRCRRGPSRGHSNQRRPPPNHGSVPTLPEEVGAPATAFGVNSVVTPAATLAPPPPTCESPRVAPRPLRPSIRQTSQCAELRFDCTSCNATLTAFITVTLREEVPNIAPPCSATPLSPPSSSFPCAAPATSVPPSQHEYSLAMGRTGRGRALSEGQEDRSDAYACRIIEEPPSPIHG